MVNAIKAMGFRKFVSVVPLNVESGDTKRPYLLSMFVKCQSAVPDSPFGSHDLAYFSSDLVPLSSRLFGRCATLCASGHDREGKLFETLGTQVWQLFDVICKSVPADVGDCEWTVIADQLAVILKATGGRCPLPADMVASGAVSPNTSPDLRPIVGAGLRSLVDSYMKLDSRKEEFDEFTQMKIGAGLEAIKSTSTGFMAMFCNNYTSPDLGVIEKLVKGILDHQKSKKGGSGHDLSSAGLVASSRNVVLQTVHEKENQKTELAIKAFLQIANQEVYS